MVNFDSISISGFILLIVGFISIFFLPGFLITERFFKRLVFPLRPPLYILLSVLIATFGIYYASLLIGFGLSSISLVLAPFWIWLVVILFRSADRSKLISKSLWHEIKKHKIGLLLGIVLALIFLIALWPAIFTVNGDGIVLAVPNWQDTAMHLGIINSIAEGNFPPQAPYYAGVPLSYYYFSDFHSAILARLSQAFFPRVLVYTNPMFLMAFAWAMYGLGYYFSQRKLMGIFSSVLGAFYGNFMFLRFFDDLSVYPGFWNKLSQIPEILSSKTYTIEYLQVMTVSPMSDYFLQNRPAMVGLVAFVVCLYLVIESVKKRDYSLMILAGIITGSQLKFHYFSFLSIAVITGTVLAWYWPEKGIRQSLKLGLAYSIPVIVFLVSSFAFFSVAGRGALTLFKENFAWQIWHEQSSTWWHVKFAFANFGIQIGLAFTALLMILRSKDRTNYLVLVIVAFILSLIPYVFRFTIARTDMIKFFYFALTPVTILAAFALVKLWQVKWLGKFAVLTVLLIASSTSLLTLGNSYFNKWHGYSIADYNAGRWIADNTPQKSVFLTAPTVHSPVTQIGGRLRVLSYTVWPYSHGFHNSDDNVFSRLDDEKNVLNPLTSPAKRDELIDKYNINYVYYGESEKNEFPKGILVLSSDRFSEIYSVGNISIYEVRDKN